MQSQSGWVILHRSQLESPFVREMQPLREEGRFLSLPTDLEQLWNWVLEHPCSSVGGITDNLSSLKKKPLQMLVKPQIVFSAPATLSCVNYLCLVSESCTFSLRAEEFHT